MSDLISRHEFFKLYKLLKEKLINDNPGFELPTSDTEIIGWGKYKNAEGIYIRNYLDAEANTAYLYNLLVKFQPADIPFTTITEKPMNALLNAVGIKNIEAFKRKCNEFVEVKAYQCIYYSFTKMKVMTCPVKFIKFWDERIIAVVTDFYDGSGPKELSSEVKLVNKIIILEMEKGNHYLNFQLQSHGEMSDGIVCLPSSNVLQGQITGISSYDYLISLECIMLSEKLVDDKNERDNAFKYLILKRRHNRVQGKETNRDTTKNLLINRVAIDAIAGMAGKTYRIWNYSYDRKVIWQSRFSIDNNYRASIETPDDELIERAPFVCHITISQPAKLLVTAFRKNYLSLSTIINIPKSINSITQGVFCTVGNGSHPGANFFVMRADSDNDFKACTINVSDFDDFLKRENYKNELEELKVALDGLPFMSEPETDNKKKSEHKTQGASANKDHKSKRVKK